MQDDVGTYGAGVHITSRHEGPDANAQQHGKDHEEADEKLHTQIHRQTDRQTDTETERETETNRQTDRQTDKKIYFLQLRSLLEHYSISVCPTCAIIIISLLLFARSLKGQSSVSSNCSLEVMNACSLGVLVSLLCQQSSCGYIQKCFHNTIFAVSE